MIKRLFNMMLQNLSLLFRNSLVWVLFATLIAMIAVVQFAIPTEYNSSRALYVLDSTSENKFESKIKNNGLQDKYFMHDQMELEEKVSNDSNSIGLKFDGASNNPEITIFYQGNISQQNLNVVKASITRIVSNAAGLDKANSPDVRFLRSRIQPVPKNLAFVSVLMVFEVLILGFLFAAVFIFQEKSEGSIRAYRVTPGSTLVYIASKALAFLAVGIVYGIMLVLPTIGFSINYLLLLCVTIIGFILYTLIGMAIAVFFNNISEWFFMGISVLFINMIPVFSHEFPSFSPAWVTWFPSYSVLYCYDEIFFSSGKSLLSPIILLAVETAAAYMICHILVNRKLMREGKQ